MSELPEWAQALPAELHDLPHLAGAQSPADFKAKVVNDAQYRGQSIRIPTDEAGEEGWKEFNEKLQTRVPALAMIPREDDEAGYESLFHKLGKPKAADGYNLEDGRTFTGDLEALKGYAFNAKMTNAQFRALANQLNDSQVSAQEAAKQGLATGMATLKAEWGQAFDDRMAATVKVLEGAPAYILESFKAGTLPADQIRYFYSLHQVGAEGSEVVNQESQNQPKMTPDEARQRLDDHEAKYKGIARSHPDWKYYVDRRLELIGAVYPEA
jgi:hypothetical protein